MRKMSKQKTRQAAA